MSPVSVKTFRLSTLAPGWTSTDKLGPAALLVEEEDGLATRSSRITADPSTVSLTSGACARVGAQRVRVRVTHTDT